MEKVVVGLCPAHVLVYSFFLARATFKAVFMAVDIYEIGTPSENMFFPDFFPGGEISSDLYRLFVCDIEKSNY